MPELTSLEPTPRASDTSVRVGLVAAGQWGVITRGQLERCGLGGSTISRWVAAGRLYRRYAGVYAVGHPHLAPEGDLVAALFSAGPGATLSHAAAAWWWGLVDAPPEAIDISVPRRRRSGQGLRLHTPRRLERTWHRRLPVTTVERTLIDLAAITPVGRLRRLLAEADYRGLLDASAVESMLGRGRRGSGALRAAGELHWPELALTRSALEERFLGLCEQGGIARPLVNETVCGLMVDALWPREQVIVELDGRAAHSKPAQMERDRERDLRLRSAGHLVLRYTWHQVTRRPGQVLTDLRVALSAAKPTPSDGLMLAPESLTRLATSA